ncbi:hypothetical protein AB0469_31675 [Streptomyces sp. NPDC093801]|uniref:hypothetical protein n=1 Tax=Streptomyces sp. NPDC093801 TaxID=3155203 RepID=UPI0034505950
MKIRADIAEMLRDGLTDRQIEKQAGVNHVRISAARAAMGIPKCRGGQRPQESLEKGLRDRAREVAGGHWEWLGTFSRSCPVFRFNGIRVTAYRAAFVARYGRRPVGAVRPVCGYPHCVAPDHVDDQAGRDRTDAVYAALFGGAK